jgi:ribonuclease P protein component
MPADRVATQGYIMLGNFKKSERLCSRKSIGRLFSSGNCIYHYPFRLVWQDSDAGQPFPVRMAVSVPGRKIKKAVVRNHVKRLIRESYRLNKGILYDNLILQNRKIEMMFIYISVNVYDYAFIELKIREVIRKLIAQNAPDKEIL